ILARDKKTGWIGVCIATSSPAVGNRCIFAGSHIGAVVVQASEEPRLGRMGLDLLEFGYSAKKVVAELTSNDPDPEVRQLGVVDARGGVAYHVGRKNRDHAGRITGDGFVVIGNLVKSPATLEAIAQTYERFADLDFDERLLRAIEGGRDAGGQFNN